MNKTLILIMLLFLLVVGLFVFTGFEIYSDQVLYGTFCEEGGFDGFKFSLGNYKQCYSIEDDEFVFRNFACEKRKCYFVREGV